MSQRRTPRPTGGEPLEQRYRIGLDIGGTFTDFVLFDTRTSRLRIHKCLTTPKDPSLGALAGLEELCQIAGIRLADVGLLATRGFRDSLEMGIEQRYDIYDLFLRYPEPLVPRDLRREVAERTSRDG